jgi:hypothetical protein
MAVHRLPAYHRSGDANKHQGGSFPSRPSSASQRLLPDSNPALHATASNRKVLPPNCYSKTVLRINHRGLSNRASNYQSFPSEGEFWSLACTGPFVEYITFVVLADVGIGKRGVGRSALLLLIDCVRFVSLYVQCSDCLGGRVRFD